MSKQIYFNDEEIDELQWIVQEYKITNVDPYSNNTEQIEYQKENRICKQILDKLGVK